MTASAVVQYLHHETFNKSPDDSAAAAGAGAADGAPMNGAAGAPTIRRALVKLVLACVLPMALAAAGLIDYVYSSERLGLTASAVNRARAIAFSLDRELGGVTAVGAAPPARMADMLAAQKLPSNWRAAIIDPGARVAARSHDAASFVGKPVMPDLRARMLLYSEGAYESRTLDGIDVLTVYSQAPASGWTIALGIPLADLTASLYRGIGWLVLCTLAAAGAGVLMASLIARRIAASMTALIGPASALGGDTALHLPPLHFAEARILGSALEEAHLALAAMRAGLRASAQRLDLATQATGIGIWVRHLDNGEIWASAQWRTLFGFGAEQAFSFDDVLARIHPDDRATVGDALLGIARHGGSYDIEYRLLPPGGALRWIASRGRIGSSESGSASVVLGVSSDVSARKLAELALQRKQEQVVHLARVSVIGELSGTLAHEINQPLTSILSNAQAAQRLIERSPPPLAEIGDILADIVAEDRRAAEVIRRLRGLLKNSEAVREPVDFKAIVDDVLGLLRNDLLNRDIRVDAAVGADLPPVAGDHVQLQQVLINLLVNACDAITGDPGARRAVAVTVAAHCAGQVELTVRDGGPGLGSGSGEVIFEPFHTTKQDGMGLGLSICRKIIHAHGGSISAADHPDGGAVVRIRLPVQHD